MLFRFWSLKHVVVVVSFSSDTIHNCRRHASLTLSKLSKWCFKSIYHRFIRYDNPLYLVLLLLLLLFFRKKRKEIDHWCPIWKSFTNLFTQIKLMHIKYLFSWNNIGNVLLRLNFSICLCIERIFIIIIFTISTVIHNKNEWMEFQMHQISMMIFTRFDFNFFSLLLLLVFVIMCVKYAIGLHLNNNKCI